MSSRAALASGSLHSYGLGRTYTDEFPSLRSRRAGRALRPSPDPPEALGELPNSGIAIPGNCSREELHVGLRMVLWLLRAYPSNNSPFHPHRKGLI